MRGGERECVCVCVRDQRVCEREESGVRDVCVWLNYRLNLNKTIININHLYLPDQNIVSLCVCERERCVSVCWLLRESVCVSVCV